VSIVPKLLNQAAELFERGQFGAAGVLCAEALEVAPEEPDAWYLSGRLAEAEGRWPDARHALEKAVALRPAEARSRAALASVLAATGEAGEASRVFAALLREFPDRGDWWSILSGLRYSLGNLAGAEEAARAAIALGQGHPEAYLNLSLVHLGRLEFAEAEKACERAIEIDSSFAHAHFTLGNIYLTQGRHDAASDSYRRVLELFPDHADALINLGNIHREHLDITAAGRLYQRAVEAAPHSAAAHSNLGIVLKDQGKMNEALGAFRRALTLDPSMHLARSNLLFCLCFKVDADPAEVFAEHIRFDELHAKPLRRENFRHSNAPDPDRRLRIGLLSPDLRLHPGGHFFLPIVEGLDRNCHEVFCYYNYIVRDEWTERFERSAEHFHYVAQWDDERLAAQIRADGIDILLEGAGHMSGNRLLVAARKPAPVQIALPLYPNTTGVSAIDYRLLDRRVALDSAEDLHVERIIRLPDTHFCYRPLERDIEPATRAPADDNGFVTFGSFNNAIKLNDLTVAAWSEILRAVPTARLVLKWLEFDQAQSASILDRFAACGIDPHRIDRFGWSSDPYKPYRQLDICLDPIFASGGTTTCDALWMGVPVVTIAGESVFSRTGLMHLTNIGLPQLIATDVDAYVDIAAGLASDPEKLRSLRQGLRERMKASPIMDEARYIGFVEAEFRRAWQKWCKAQLTPTAGPRR
jgi:protein O-GlcNAc transferase